MPVCIIYNRGTQFTSRFWTVVQCELGTRVDLSTTFLPSDGRTVRAYYSDTGGYALCMCDGFWGFLRSVLAACGVCLQQHLQSGIQMAPCKALYGRRCRSSVGWFDPGEARLLGTNLVQGAS